MKQIFYAILALAMLLPLATSCSKSNDDQPKNYATESEIQGKWGYVGEYASYIFEFKKPNYSIFVKSGKDTELETGTYTMSANGTINLKPSSGKTSLWSPLEAYWEGSGKNMLHFYPVGSFVKM